MGGCWADVPVAWLNGGPAALVWGALIAGIGSTLVASCLGEMASIDPSVGAQYRWSARFAQRAPAFWGFMQGMTALNPPCTTCWS
jgi:amino acid permease